MAPWPLGTGTRLDSSRMAPVFPENGASHGGVAGAGGIITEVARMTRKNGKVMHMSQHITMWAYPSRRHGTARRWRHWRTERRVQANFKKHAAGFRRILPGATRFYMLRSEQNHYETQKAV